jgi:hypothetical protein
MGFFSWACKGCNHSILNPFSINAKNAWMAKVTMLTKNGTVVHGDYDGYGRIENYSDPDSRSVFEIDWDKGEPELWHTECWKHVGKPEYSGPSDSARDQGYFFDDADHDFSSPLVTGELPPEYGNPTLRDRLNDAKGKQ